MNANNGKFPTALFWKIVTSFDPNSLHFLPLVCNFIDAALKKVCKVGNLPENRWFCLTSILLWVTHLSSVTMCHPTIKLSIVFEFGIETHDRAWCSINIFIDWESLKNQQNSLISSFFGAKLREWQERLTWVFINQQPRRLLLPLQAEE